MLKVFIGKDGAFTSMLKSFVEKALESEMEGLLEKEEYSKGNKRSVKGKRHHDCIGIFATEYFQESHSTIESELINRLTLTWSIIFFLITSKLTT